MDCSPSLNWMEGEQQTLSKKIVVFQSLVATVKSQPALNISLEAKAVHFIRSVDPQSIFFADALFRSLASFSDYSLTEFIVSVVDLLSSPSQGIIQAAKTMLAHLIFFCSEKVHLSLVKTDLIHQLINTLNPLSLSCAGAEDIHTGLISTIHSSLRLTTPSYLEKLENTHDNEQQSVHETVLKQVLAPSETYICHLCANRFSIIDESVSNEFMELLARLLHISPYYQPTMDFVLNMPIIFTIPNCLTFFEDENTIDHFLNAMVDTHRDWDETGGKDRQMWKTMHRMLRMEGIEDAIEEKLRDRQNARYGGWIATNSIEWSNLQGTNLPEQE
ncbi:hypothetical protein BLNAU_12369 [Blattamonas nauphoetae]|uniref:Uncharacterized protein n=1 Tax=Blattamonas nauphoetae TaxID=2049346 RepID=A0ABQ9XR88_9EUKA|nr:hypothetical protein BLNAU_12369 [Blattamonas nauphoetae]